MGVSCRACLQGPFCHKPHESGPACYKYMISARAGRTCDLRRGGAAKWIGKNIRHDWRSRKFVDRGTGEPLTVEEANDYKRYIHQVEAPTSWLNWWGSTILA